MKRKPSPINGEELPIGRPFKQGDEQRQIARKGGIKSGEVRRMKRTLREQLEMLMLEQVHDNKGNKITLQKGISSALVKQAFEGNTRAYEIIRDTLGQKPTENINVNLPDSTVMDEIRKRMEGEKV